MILLSMESIKLSSRDTESAIEFVLYDSTRTPVYPHYDGLSGLLRSSQEVYPAHIVGDEYRHEDSAITTDASIIRLNYHLVSTIEGCR